MNSFEYGFFDELRKLAEERKPIDQDTNYEKETAKNQVKEDLSYRKKLKMMEKLIFIIHTFIWVKLKKVNVEWLKRMAI